MKRRSLLSAAVAVGAAYFWTFFPSNRGAPVIAACGCVIDDSPNWDVEEFDAKLTDDGWLALELRAIPYDEARPLEIVVVREADDVWVDIVEVEDSPNIREGTTILLHKPDDAGKFVVWVRDSDAYRDTVDVCESPSYCPGTPAGGGHA